MFIHLFFIILNTILFVKNEDYSNNKCTNNENDNVEKKYFVNDVNKCDMCNCTNINSVHCDQKFDCQKLNCTDETGNELICCNKFNCAGIFI